MRAYGEWLKTRLRFDTGYSRWLNYSRARCFSSSNTFSFKIIGNHHRLRMEEWWCVCFLHGCLTSLTSAKCISGADLFRKSYVLPLCDRGCGSNLHLVRSRLRRNFPGRVIPVTLKLATLPGAWRCRASAGTGWSGVSILRLGEMENLICNFCLSMEARKIV